MLVGGCWRVERRPPSSWTCRNGECELEYGLRVEGMLEQKGCVSVRRSAWWGGGGVAISAMPACPAQLARHLAVEASLMCAW
jgi:hypothetical protein